MCRRVGEKRYKVLTGHTRQSLPKEELTYEERVTLESIYFLYKISRKDLDENQFNSPKGRHYLKLRRYANYARYGTDNPLAELRRLMKETLCVTGALQDLAEEINLVD